MNNQSLKKAIRELADQLSYLPENKIAEIIANVIEDLLPFAILEMRDDLITIDDSKLNQLEFRERRTYGGRDRQILEDKISIEREVLEHLRIAKTAAVNLREVNYGSMVMVAQQQAQPYVPNVEHVSNNMEIEYTRKDHSSQILNYGIRFARGENMRYTVDDSLIDRMKDLVFTKFCSTIERTSRRLAMDHRDEFNFILKEKKDIELPDWNRTVLFIQFPKIPFEAADTLWSTLSNETRNDMNKTLKQLPSDEQKGFKNYVDNFNVEMDF